MKNNNSTGKDIKSLNEQNITYFHSHSISHILSISPDGNCFYSSLLSSPQIFLDQISNSLHTEDIILLTTKDLRKYISTILINVFCKNYEDIYDLKSIAGIFNSPNKKNEYFIFNTDTTEPIELTEELINSSIREDKAWNNPLSDLLPSIVSTIFKFNLNIYRLDSNNKFFSISFSSNNTSLSIDLIHTTNPINHYIVGIRDEYLDEYISDSLYKNQIQTINQFLLTSLIEEEQITMSTDNKSLKQIKLSTLKESLTNLKSQQNYTEFKNLYNSNKTSLNKDIESISLLISVYKILKEYNNALDFISTLTLPIANRYRFSLEGLELYSLYLLQVKDKPVIDITKQEEYKELIVLINETNNREEYYNSLFYKELFNILSLSEQIKFLNDIRVKDNPIGISFLKLKLKEQEHNLNDSIDNITYNNLFSILDNNKEYETILKLSNQKTYKLLFPSNQKIYFKSIFNTKDYNLIYESLKVIDILTIKQDILPIDKHIDNLWLLHAYACNKVSDYKESYDIYDSLLDEQIFKTTNYIQFKDLLINSHIEVKDLYSLSNTLFNYSKELNLTDRLNNTILFSYRFIYESIDTFKDEDKYSISIEYKEIVDRLNILPGYENESLVTYLHNIKNQNNTFHGEYKKTLKETIIESFLSKEYKKVIDIYNENKSILINDEISSLHYFKSLQLLKEHKTIVDEYRKYKDKYITYTNNSTSSDNGTIASIYSNTLINIQSIELSKSLIYEMTDGSLLLQSLLSLEVLNLLQDRSSYLLKDIEDILSKKSSELLNDSNLFQDLHKRLMSYFLSQCNSEPQRESIKNNTRQVTFDKEQIFNYIKLDIETDVFNFINNKAESNIDKQYTDNSKLLDKFLIQEGSLLSYSILNSINQDILLYENINTISNEYIDININTENILSNRFNHLLRKLNSIINSNIDNEYKFIILIRTIETSFIVKYYEGVSYRDTLLLYKRINSNKNIRIIKELCIDYLSTIDNQSELYIFLSNILNTISDTYRIKGNNISIIKNNRYLNRLLEIDIEKHTISTLTVDNEYDLKLLSILDFSNTEYDTEDRFKTPQYNRLRYTLIEILYKCKDNYIEGFNLIFNYIQKNQNSILLLNSSNIDELYKELKTELQRSIFFLENTNTISSSITYLIYGHILDRVFHVDNDLYQRIYDVVNLYLLNQVSRDQLINIIIDNIKTSDIHQKLNILSNHEIDLLEEELTIISDKELLNISKQFTNTYRELLPKVNEYVNSHNVLNKEELNRQLSSIKEVHYDIDTIYTRRDKKD